MRDRPHICNLYSVLHENLRRECDSVRLVLAPITKTYLYNFDPLKPHFYMIKLRFTGVYIIFLISAQKHRLWVLVRTASPRRFYQVPTIYVLSRNMKNIRIFLSENFQFLVVKISMYLNRRVFVMPIPGSCFSSRKHTYIILTPLNPTFIL